MIRIEAILDDGLQTKSSVTFTVEIDECIPVEFALMSIPDQILTVENEPYKLSFEGLSQAPCNFGLEVFAFL